MSTSQERAAALLKAHRKHATKLAGKCPGTKPVGKRFESPDNAPPYRRERRRMMSADTGGRKGKSKYPPRGNVILQRAMTNEHGVPVIKWRKAKRCAQGRGEPVVLFSNGTLRRRHMMQFRTMARREQGRDMTLRFTRIVHRLPNQKRRFHGLTGK